MKKKIRIAIIGLGNCASSLIQGIEYYSDRKKEVIGLMHQEILGYHPSDIEVVCAFDIDERKVGKDISEAIFSRPNCTIKFADVPEKGVKVEKGEVLDGICQYTKDKFLIDESQKPVDVVKSLIDNEVDLLINYLPVGSTKATKFYAQCALDAGVGFINAMPVFIASDNEWANKFYEKNIPIIGDDVKSQFGATIVHRVLSKLANDRGVKIDNTYQLNVGGNTDFLNMLERERLTDKKISKTEAVQSQLDKPLNKDNIHIGPSDYIPFLKDEKIMFVRMSGRIFGDIPISMDIRLSVIDSPNSGGVMIDCIRLMKVALDRGIGGRLLSSSSYFMKHPPIQFSDAESYQNVEKFIKDEKER